MDEVLENPYYDITIPNADRVLPHLFIGNYAAGEDEKFLTDNRVTYILNLTPDKHRKRLEGITYLNLVLHDSAHEDISRVFDQAHDYLTTVRLEGAVALVHCHMGISRATTMTMSHILLSGKIYDDIDEHRESGKMYASRGFADDKASSAGEQVSFAEVWRLVRTRRKCALPNPGFVQYLGLLEMKLTGQSTPSVKPSDLPYEAYVELPLEI
ncbi:dual specificity protein phosphatase 22-like [Sycon ciliatum]|uniref:dual specificity protein phosphatase 22-like n=1 Tax=Sycon ciliatum TaxID=27933 RepID=UPI0031F70D14